MPTLLIFDRDADHPNMVLPFETFLRRVLEIEPSLAERRWEIFDADYGYGERIAELQNRVEDGPVETNLSSLLEMSNPPHAYIEDIMLRSEGGYYLGRFDSTYNVLSGPAEVLEKVRPCFSKVEIEDEPWDETRG